MRTSPPRLRARHTRIHARPNGRAKIYFPFIGKNGWFAEKFRKGRLLKEELPPP
jgi:hypothetical protein